VFIDNSAIKGQPGARSPCLCRVWGRVQPLWVIRLKTNTLLPMIIMSSMCSVYKLRKPFRLVSVYVAMGVNCGSGWSSLNETSFC
jgi:hypothetical protein